MAPRQSGQPVSTVAERLALAPPNPADHDAVGIVHGMTDSRASEAVAVLRERCTGRMLVKVLVHGINALKTFDPPLDAITAVPVDAAAVTGEATVEIAAGPYVLLIDLQRTGRLKLDDPGREWSPGEPSMPTVQLVLADNVVANFVEPGKTKRIALRAATRG